jgi:hypothetical protein
MRMLSCADDFGGRPTFELLAEPRRQGPLS